MAFYLLGTKDTARWVLERGGVVYAAGNTNDRLEAIKELAVVRSGAAPPEPTKVEGGWIIVFRNMVGKEFGRGLHVHATRAECVDEAIRAMRPEPLQRTQTV